MNPTRFRCVTDSRSPALTTLSAKHWHLSIDLSGAGKMPTPQSNSRPVEQASCPLLTPTPQSNSCLVERAFCPLLTPTPQSNSCLVERAFCPLLTPTPKSNSCLVERASCPLLRMLQDMS